MLVDFGLMKGSIKQFIDSMDHCYLLCSKDDPKFREFIKSSCDRYIELPFNPSAEMLSMFIMVGVQYILDNTRFCNGEHQVAVSGVRYHETTTGYAQCDVEDCNRYMATLSWDDIVFSDGVKKDWSPELRDLMEYGKTIENPIVERQITL
jgi:6-pyruvoyltetrahydropterin/6-carboxytetrahydropterin synthase